MRDHPPRVLIAYGSRRGSADEIAEVIAKTLADEGVAADVADAADVRSVAGYDAVLIGGALHANKWPRAARKLILHHAKALRTRPVWLFSCGPLDLSADERILPPTMQVAGLMERVGARSHTMFDGRLEVRSWAKHLAHVMLEHEPRPLPTPSVASRAYGWILAALCLAVGLAALVIGVKPLAYLALAALIALEAWNVLARRERSRPPLLGSTAKSR